MIFWISVYPDLDEVQIFTQAFIKNDERRCFSFLEEVNYFREANKRFGAKVAAEIGFRAGRQPSYMREVLDVCSWIEGKLAKLHKIELMTEHRFRLSELESLSVFRGDDGAFYEAASVVAAARLVNPSDVDPLEIKALVRYYVPWFERVFPEYSTAPQGTKILNIVDNPATVGNEEGETSSRGV